MKFQKCTFLAIAFFVGCSKPDEARLVQSAIDYSYPSTYSDLSALRKDYPGFDPRVRLWSDDPVLLFGNELYAVRMPEEEVVMTKKGAVRTTSRCGSQEADCTIVAPLTPELGIVGTVQTSGPDDRPVDGFEIKWKGAPGYVHVVGHCFAVFKSSSEPLEFSIQLQGYKPIEISGFYGSRLMAMKFSKNGNFYSTIRISKAMFDDSKTCSAAARNNWPNAGGASWKR